MWAKPERIPGPADPIPGFTERGKGAEGSGMVCVSGAAGETILLCQSCLWMLQQAWNAFPGVLATDVKSLRREMLESGKSLCCCTDILGKSEHPHGGREFIPALRAFPLEHLGNVLDNAGDQKETENSTTSQNCGSLPVQLLA